MVDWTVTWLKLVILDDGLRVRTLLRVVRKVVRQAHEAKIFGTEQAESLGGIAPCLLVLEVAFEGYASVGGQA